MQILLGAEGQFVHARQAGRLVSGKTDAEVTAIFTGDQSLVTYPRFKETTY